MKKETNRYENLLNISGYDTDCDCDNAEDKDMKVGNIIGVLLKPGKRWFK